MKCFSPISAKRIPLKDEKGIITDYMITFNNDERQDGLNLELPCGQCIGCRLQKAQDWALRLCHENQLHEESSFITLTYDDKNLPADHGLAYDDVTRFIKRLRKVTGKKLSYFYSGEYGDKLRRPHYHMILFGSEFREKIKYKKQENIVDHHYTSDAGHKVYTSTLLTNLWEKGHAEFGEVTYDSCMYVAKYTTKKITGKEDEEVYQRTNLYTGELVQVEKEKARMSKKPAIGLNWIEKYQGDTFRDDYIVFDGKKHLIPNYYMKYLKKNNLDLYNEIKEKRENNTKELDKEALIREYEVLLTKHSRYTSSTGEVSKINPVDMKKKKYLKDKRDEEFRYYKNIPI